MNEPVKIDPEFQSLIPPLSSEEFQQLTENCKRDGILDSLKVWNGILIDGHNRYRIAEEWDLNYQTEEMDFTDRGAVIRWIIMNQFGRRNLSAYDRSVLALKLKPMIAEKAKENIKATQNNNSASAYQKSEKQVNTTKELAKVAGVSHDTIHKVETIESKASEPLKEQVKAGQKTINQAYLEIKEKERKQADLSAKAHLEAAKERNEDFKQQKTVTIEEAKQNIEDLAEIASSKIREIRNALKGILFMGAMVSGNDFDLSELEKNAHSYEFRELVQDLGFATEIISKIQEAILSKR